MLTKVRIEVEERTVAETVEALAKYEAAITTAEAQRYDDQWPHEYQADPLKPGESKRLDREPEFHWDQVEFPDYQYMLGRELIEEVIEYDPRLPGWRGRIVVAYKRLDSRENQPSTFAITEGDAFVSYGSFTEAQNAGGTPLGVMVTVRPPT